jgi:hypothetical protein
MLCLQVGMRLHQRNYERVRACWDAWQLRMLQAQEQRRQAILWNAAAAFREKELLVAGVQAFRRSVADAREQRRLRLLQAKLFAEWRQLAATSGEAPRLPTTSLYDPHARRLTCQPDA